MCIINYNENDSKNSNWYFRNKIARLRLKSDRKLQLRANPKYPAIRYDGMFVDVKENVILEADCTTSPRLKGIFKSMKDQFKN